MLDFEKAAVKLTSFLLEDEKETISFEHCIVIVFKV